MITCPHELEIGTCPMCYKEADKGPSKKPLYDAIEWLEAENKLLKSQLISVFSHERVPQFSQGEPNHEVLELVTAEDCTGWVSSIEGLRKALSDIKWHRPIGGSPTKYEYEVEVMAWKALESNFASKAVGTDAIESLQAKIDALMLEYCPDEMTKEQLTNWAEHQAPAQIKHKGRCLSPGIYDSLYECEHCGIRHTQSIDDVSTDLPKLGCNHKLLIKGR